MPKRRSMDNRQTSRPKIGLDGPLASLHTMPMPEPGLSPGQIETVPVVMPERTHDAIHFIEDTAATASRSLTLPSTRFLANDHIRSGVISGVNALRNAA